LETAPGDRHGERTVFPILLEIRLVDDPKSCRFSSVSKSNEGGTIQIQLVDNFVDSYERYPDAQIYFYTVYDCDGSVVMYYIYVW
jgi:hypothetical protein